jgi:hypothetical protein
MTAKQAVSLTSASNPLVIIAGVVWLVTYAASRFVMEKWLPVSPWDILFASPPIFGFFWFVWAVQRSLRSSDEMQRRIHLEALALAFSTSMLVLMFLGLMDGIPAGGLELPLRDVWFVLPVIYGICFAIAKQRYR